MLFFTNVLMGTSRQWYQHSFLHVTIDPCRLIRLGMLDSLRTTGPSGLHTPFLRPSSGKFHQHFISKYFCAKNSCAKKSSTLKCKHKKKLCAKLSYEKAARKMLVKLTPHQLKCRYHFLYVMFFCDQAITIFFIWLRRMCLKLSCVKS